MSGENTNRLSGIFGAAAQLVQMPSGRIATLPITQLKPGKGQPRKQFNEKELEILAQSIKAKGVQHPLLVRPVVDGYEIVAGERRWRAAQLAGLLEVPVVEKQMSDQEAAEAALIENLQRKDLNSFEQIDGKLRLVAITWQITPDQARTRLNELLRHPQEEESQLLTALFQSLGKETWQSYAKNKLRVYNWPAPLIQALEEGMLMGTATLIARVDEQNLEHLIRLWRAGVSRSTLAEEVKKLSSKPEAGLEERLAKRLKDRKWLQQLPPAQAEQLQVWLQTMPEELQRSLE